MLCCPKTTQQVLCLARRLPLLPSPHRALDTASWAQIQQRLQDFSQDTQAELERERAQLMVRATMAEQQLSELQEYVDQHLGRYKQEILKLRKLVNIGDPQGVEAVSSPGSGGARL